MRSNEVGPFAQDHSPNAHAEAKSHPECPRIDHIVVQLRAAINAARQGLQADVATSVSTEFRVRYDEKGVELYPTADCMELLPFFKSCLEDYGLEFSALGAHGVFVYGSKTTNLQIH